VSRGLKTTIAILFVLVVFGLITLPSLRQAIQRISGNPRTEEQSRREVMQIPISTPTDVKVKAQVYWLSATSPVSLEATTVELPLSADPVERSKQLLIALIADAPTPTAWGDWADEYWTVYPDGVAIRRQVLWSTAPERDKTEFQESIVLIPAGETPEDSIHFDALRFANLQGDAHTYSWRPKTDRGLSLPKGPEHFTEPADAVIQWVNLKSTWKPFQVAWGAPVKFDVYNGDQSISTFEWWNHWPVAQIPSSGRPALAADRPGHTSLSHIYWPISEQDDQHIGRILMTGLTTLEATQLAPLAASWRTPAQADVTDGASIRYDAAQRAYVLSGAMPDRSCSPRGPCKHSNHRRISGNGWRRTMPPQPSSGSCFIGRLPANPR